LRLAVSQFREHYIGGAGAYLWLLSGAVGFVLLMACVNVANLTLARSLARRKEMAIRVALGAGRSRLLRQMLTESLCLTLPGGLLGLASAAVTAKLLSRLMQFDLPPWMKVEIDGRALLFTLAVSLLTGLGAGLLPALQASKPDLNESLKDGVKGAAGGGGLRARRALVITQVALALTLLAGAALMITSLLRLRQTPLGFDGRRLLTMKIDPPWAKYRELGQIALFYKRVIEEVERIPGVEAAAFNDSLPLAGQDVREGANKLTVEIEGQARDEKTRNPFVNAQIVSPGYFRALKIPLAQGRFFDGRDHEKTAPTAIISERLAARFWPGRQPIGKRLRLGGRGQNFQPGESMRVEPWLTVAGVAGDVRQRGVASEAGLDVYVCDQQDYAPESYLAVRAAVDPLTLVQQVKQAIWRADPEQSAFDMWTMEQRILQAIWQQRLTGLVFTLFAALALTLASVGIYGVMNYLVNQRAREIGVRMALGARGLDALRMVLGEAMKLVAIGGAIGLAAALALTRVMASLLYGVSANDPATFIGVLILLASVALVACYLPARRAARVDPVVALRSE
jgi:predicted permease